MEIQSIWIVIALLLGLCVGSFLNVVIYRLPRGMSVSSPKRSFCPACKNQFPWWCNIPVMSWIFLGGKCRSCKGKIAFRYVLVEVFTALSFVAMAVMFPPAAAAILFVFVSLCVVIAWIDAEHTVIPTYLTWVGAGFGLLYGWVSPRLLLSSGELIEISPWRGLGNAAFGGVMGFSLLWLIAQLGKWAFGKIHEKFDAPLAWKIRAGRHGEQEMLELQLGEDVLPWWDMFSRKSDVVVLNVSEFLLNGISHEAGQLTLREQNLTLPDGKIVAWSDVESLSGLADEVTIPREAMGAGDAYLVGMLGTFCGAPGVVFLVVAATFLALAYSVLGKLGFGKQLPFGPFLIAAAFVWLWGGWHLYAWYLNAVLGI